MRCTRNSAIWPVIDRPWPCSKIASPRRAPDFAELTTAVCVCTANRPDVIGQALESVLDQSHEVDEVIVVDQSDGMETARVVAAIQSRHSHVRYLHVVEKGLSRAYNTAITNTTAKILAFTDDDCVAPHDWLEAIVRCFEDEPDTSLLYGQVLLPPDLQARENVEGVTPSLPILRRRRMSRHDGFEVFGMGANFAARRAMLTDIAGFDEVLGGGGPLQSAQDFDLSYRAFRRGHVILLSPDVVVHHYGFRRSQDWPRTVGSYGVGVGGFYAKHLRLGDTYAASLFARFLIRHTLRAGKSTLLRRGGLDWTLLTHTVLGLGRSFRYPINRRDKLYRSPGARAA